MASDLNNEVSGLICSLGKKDQELKRMSIEQTLPNHDVCSPQLGGSLGEFHVEKHIV